uniref:Mediator of RNA polymerase II transcription subunit 23 n=2 Tax=Anthurium amnicola TaxID=1678845 RepID=A0A1D1XDU2_9ARAE
MEQSGPRTPRSPHQFHPARAAIVDLFNLYLGRSSRHKSEDLGRETSNKMQKRVIALNRELPPPNEQFLLDFEQLRGQFPDQEQLRAVTESVLLSFVVQCSGHAPQADFILFALCTLCNIDSVKWDTFLLSLLSTVSSTEATVGHVSQPNAGVSPGMVPSSSAAVSNNSNFHVSNPASPLSSIHGIGSPAQSATEQSTAANLSPVKTSDLPGPHFVSRTSQSLRGSSIGYLRHLSCKIILAALESNLKPATHAEIFSHMLNWLVYWDQRYQGIDESDATKDFKLDSPLNEWLRICLDVIWKLVEEDRCRIPFYELLRSGLQFMDNIPDDEALFSIMLEIHKRKDMAATHMQMLDQHLHCPTFGTHRFVAHAYPSITGEPLANLRYSPITYPSVLGEPLHGEDLANSIQRGTLDWERALRCLRHALRSTPSPDWWRRVLLVAPCYRHAQQASTPGAVFSSEMVCEAVVDRTMELLKSTSSETHCWQEWLSFADVFFFLMKSGCIDFLDFVNKLASRVTDGDQQILRSNHVTWLLAQIIRIEIVMNTLSSDPKKVETIRKIISFHREDRNTDPSSVTPHSILLDFISSSQTLRIWSFNMAIREHLNNEQLQKGKQIDDWWKQVTKGERMDFMNLDDRSMGMFWVLSFTMAQPACDAVVNWLTSLGVIELPQGPNVQSGDKIMMMRETCPLPLSLLSGLSINLCVKLVYQLEETIFIDQVIPSIAMVETYVRLLLIAPHSLFRPHFTTLTQRSPNILNKTGVTLLLLEILNYRLLPLYRYHGKSKALMNDVTKIISMIKGKRGDHRLFRLAENLCMNLILSIRDFFLVKKELKGPTEFTETLNRVTILSLSITIKTRGIAEVDQMLYLQPLLEQIMATCQHTWSEKTMQHFPPLIREFLMGRMNKRLQAIQAWQQAETTVINQCKQLLSPTAEPTYVMTYISHSFPQHRQYLCAGAWMLMSGHPESINSTNLGRVLREFSPEEVTSNIYTMVDVLLHHIQVELQHGLPMQDLLSKASANIASLIWTHELLPLDILLLALIDRDDDPCALRIVLNMLLERQELQQRVKIFCANRVSPDYWLNSGIYKRVDLQKALGNHLSWKDRYPPFFDDIAARLLPVIPLIIYRLIENDVFDAADRVIAVYSGFLAYHPLRFTFVRDILAYFYGHLTSKLIVRILNVLDIAKIPFSESFPQHIGSSSSAFCPPQEYFSTLLLGLVNHVIPPLNSKSKTGVIGESSSNCMRQAPNKTHTSSQLGPNSTSDVHRAFYQNQDPGTSTQLFLETAAIEILSLPATASQVVSSFVQIIVHIQPTLIQSNNGLQGVSSGAGQSSALPTSPSGGSTDSLSTSRSNPSSSGINASNFISKSGYSCQQLSCLIIQACGLLLAQLPLEFHMQLYSEASRIIKDCWWLTDGKRSHKELESAVGYALLDPTWAAQDSTSTAIGNVVALLHSLFSNLPHEWLETTHMMIKNLRPISSIAMLRISFRILGPVLPRLSFARPVFLKSIALLLNCMVEVFGKNAQTPAPVEASDITDLIDFLHHAVMYEGQGGPVQSSSKPKPETLTLCGKVMDMLRPDVQHLICHLNTDPKSSIYAATHPKLVQNPT